MASTPNLAVLVTHCGQLRKKLVNLMPSDVRFFRLKYTKFDFPDPTGEAYSAPPDPLAAFKGAYF